MAAQRWSPSKFDAYPGKGCASCGTPYKKDAPTVYDGEAKKIVRCEACPDLTPQDLRSIEKVRLDLAAAAATAEENKRRAAEAPADLAAYIEQAGANLGAAIPMIAAHPGILADLARHRIEVGTLIASLVHLAAADATRSACSLLSWHAAAEQCAGWGLIPTAAQDTPVFLFCRDRGAGKLACERTRWGFATQIARALPDANLAAGWVFSPEATLGDLADRIRRRLPGAQEEAQAVRDRLAAKKGERTADQDALAEGFRAWFALDQPWPEAARGALIRLGKATDNPIAHAAYRHVLRREPVSAEERSHLEDVRESLEALAEGLTAAEESLLTALRLPGWTEHPWYQAAGPAEERAIEWAPPSYALWPRPPMDPTRLDGIPVIWWARLKFTDGDTIREIGFELSRTDVYERACAGGQVQISSAGLLVAAKAGDPPAWLKWHGPMGCVKAIRELLKAHPTLFERFKALAVEVGNIETDDTVIEGETMPTVGRDHLAAVRKQIEQNAPIQDFAAENARLSQRATVDAKETP